jgi:hypothetical protein
MQREIPWDELGPRDLSEAHARVLGEEWHARMIQEHLAVGAFSELALELANTGCDTVVLSMVTRAAADEVRHRELCRRLASEFFGEPVSDGYTGVPTIPQHSGASPPERALLHLVEMGCLSETFTGAYLTRMLSHAKNKAMRAAIASLLKDEIDHGRLGWAHLAASARDGRAVCVGPALPAMLERTMSGVMNAALPSAPPDPVLESYGRITPHGAKECFAETLRDVILPGFASRSPVGTGGRHAVLDSGVTPTGGRSTVATGPGDTGIAMCQCPSESFFVEVRGDGDPAVLSFEGMHVPPWCEGASTSNVPLGSGHLACGLISLGELSACAGPNHGPPCLDVTASGSDPGTYVDRTGRTWRVRRA